MKRPTALTPLWIIASIASIALAGCGGSDDDPPADPTLVQTQQGPVKGASSNGVQRFLGIPYAAPPTGALRWKPPAAPLARTGTLEASQSGAVR